MSLHAQTLIVFACVLIFMFGWTAIIWYNYQKHEENKPNDERDQDYFDVDPYDEDELLP